MSGYQYKHWKSFEKYEGAKQNLHPWLQAFEDRATSLHYSEDDKRIALRDLVGHMDANIIREQRPLQELKNALLSRYGQLETRNSVLGRLIAMQQGDDENLVAYYQRHQQLVLRLEATGRPSGAAKLEMFEQGLNNTSKLWWRSLGHPYRDVWEGVSKVSQYLNSNQPSAAESAAKRVKVKEEDGRATFAILQNDTQREMLEIMKETMQLMRRSVGGRDGFRGYGKNHCWDWQQKGKCNRGAECRYLHAGTEQ